MRFPIDLAKPDTLGPAMVEKARDRGWKSGGRDAIVKTVAKAQDPGIGTIRLR